MGTAVEVPFRIELRDSSNRRMGTGRSTGVHLSDVLTWARGKVEADEWERRKLAAAPAGDAYMKLGFVWEAAIEKAMASYIRGQHEKGVGQQEIIVDDIAGTIDRRVTKGGWRGVEEYKFTFRSERQLILPPMEESEEPKARFAALEEHFFWWMAQLGGYCYMASVKFQEDYSRGRLVPFFGNGDYSRKPPHGFPHPHCFEIRFGPRWLANNWRMVLRNRDAMLKERKEQACAKSRRTK